jgi:ABC-type multidrug transport system permease subunit
MLKKVFKPFTWLIIFAVINFIAAGIGSLVAGEGAAEEGWGEGNVLAHDVYYETSFGFMFIALSVIAAGLAFLTSGIQRAKMTVLFGATMALMIISVAVYSSGEGYSMLGVGILIPIILMSLVALSGILHIKEE